MKHWEKHVAVLQKKMLLIWKINMAKSFARWFIKRKSKHRVGSITNLNVNDRLVEKISSRVWSWKRGRLKNTREM